MEQEVGQDGIPFAVSESEFTLFGCTGCGGITGVTPISGGGTTLFTCGNCHQTTLIVADGLGRSKIGIDTGESEVYPEVVAHPRRGQPINRDQLSKDREAKIMDEATAELSRWLRLGYGRSVKLARTSQHRSKSQSLPILAASDSEENVQVTWAAYNYYFHFLGLALKKPLPATLMYPISAVFGHRPSGHVNPEIAPVDFLTAYYGKRMLEQFGANTDDGFSAALVIRYLRELSRLDIDRIMSVCFGHMLYSGREEIDDETINWRDLFEVLGLATNDDPWHPALTNLPSNIFDEVIVDLYRKGIQGKGTIRVRLAEGTFLPPMPLPFTSICVNLQETALGSLVPVHQSGSDYVVSSLPVSVLATSFEGKQRHRIAEEQSASPVSTVYCRTVRYARDFLVSAPNILDAALTAFFLVKAVGPVIQEMRDASQ